MRLSPALLRPCAAAAQCSSASGQRHAQRHGSAITRSDKVKAALREQLKTKELKEWTAEEVKEALSMEIGGSAQTESVLQGMSDVGLDVDELYYNSPAGVLYEQALLHEKGSAIVSSGALAVKSGKKTGRSPLDKRIVFEESTADDVWWGKVNVKLGIKSFLTNRERAVDYLNPRKRLYIVGGFGG